jgi:Bacterial protein of unknown function (DUF839)
MKFQLNYVCLALTVFAGSANALVTLTNVPAANPKTPGIAAPNTLSPELEMRLQATGSMKLDGATTNTPYYGYTSNTGTAAMVPVLGSVATPATPKEAFKTEPDKNTYLVLSGQTGADSAYNYGTNFLFQGHEVGDHGYITRINLDADGAHRVTLMADTLADGAIIPLLDGSTWNPFTQKLMFTGEEAAASGANEGVVLEASTSYPSTVTKLDAVIGHAGWEGIQLASDGSLWLVADQGGVNGTVNTKAKQPNSFVYRFVPKDTTNLSLGGKLQALQVVNNGNAIVFHAGQADADILSQDMKDLHTYGKSFTTAWVTIHNTDVDGFGAFDANLAAKTASATPFKRPENGMFRPNPNKPFTEFYFTETGDTNLLSQAGSTYGGFGGIFKLSQTNPSANSGVLSMVYLGDVAHSGFDNIAFLNANQLLIVEDAGDTLHTQRNALDSGYVLSPALDYSNPSNTPVRFLAEGRDASATLDSATANLQQNGDNEITGIHVSNGDPTIAGLLGTVNPIPFVNGWRVFWNQQHGDNNSWEIVRKR